MNKFDLFEESHIVRRMVVYLNFKNQQSVFPVRTAVQPGGLVLRSKETEDNQQKAKK